LRLFSKKTIRGCESDGTADSPYLTRWTLIGSDKFAVYLHKFHRSDRDDLHDHPWPFISIILWRGYFEEVPAVWTYEPADHYSNEGLRKRKRVWPGAVLFRKATHQHRVILVNGKPAWTLVIRGAYVRDWGFLTGAGWQRWKEYFKERGC
jgi:hypothetical protein